MYRPSHFDEDDPARLAALMQRHSFATVISHDGAAPFATHMPVLFHAGAGPHGTQITHMARANPQWRHFTDGREVLVIFHGPHAYVSPSWYAKQPAVPTWNYAVVHAYGIPRFVEEATSLRVMLRELVVTFESHRAEPYGAELTDEYLDQLSPGIVGIEIPITRLEGKMKLSQNRPTGDRAGVIAALERSPDQTERETAELMRREIPRP
jgi:transcriptional regulator